MACGSQGEFPHRPPPQMVIGSALLLAPSLMLPAGAGRIPNGVCVRDQGVPRVNVLRTRIHRRVRSFFPSGFSRPTHMPLWSPLGFTHFQLPRLGRVVSPASPAIRVLSPQWSTLETPEEGQSGSLLTLMGISGHFLLSFCSCLCHLVAGAAKGPIRLGKSSP